MKRTEREIQRREEIITQVACALIQTGKYIGQNADGRCYMLGDSKKICETEVVSDATYIADDIILSAKYSGEDQD